MISKLRFLLLPLAVLLAIALGGGVYWFLESQGVVKYPGFISKLLPWEEPEPTNNGISSCDEAKTTKEGWKIYCNEDLGFSFEYPEEWGNVDFGYASDVGTVKNGIFGGGFSKMLSSPGVVFGGSSIDNYPSRGSSFDDFKYYLGQNGTFLLYFPASGQNKGFEFTINKTITIKDGEKALVIYGQEGYNFYSKKDRIAFINLKGPKFRGLVFKYVSIPKTEEVIFNLFISTISTFEP